jgi:hypothetical protein
VLLDWMLLEVRWDRDKHEVFLLPALSVVPVTISA